MALAFMKNISTAKNYAKGLNHLFPDLFAWEDIGIDITKVDEQVLAAQMQSWKAFD